MGTTVDLTEKLHNLMIFASLVDLVQMLDGKGIPQIADMVRNNHWIDDGHKNSTRRRINSTKITQMTLGVL